MTDIVETIAWLRELDTKDEPCVRTAAALRALAQEQNDDQ